MDETGPMADAITACVAETMNASTEVVVVVESTTSFYMAVANVTFLVMAAIFTSFIIFRLAILFVTYIKTGEVGDFEDNCFVYNLLNGYLVKILPALVYGIFPGAILVDIAGFMILAGIIGLFWPIPTILLPFIGVAYLIRRPIARKQEFIAKLDGSYEEGS